VNGDEEGDEEESDLFSIKLLSENFKMPFFESVSEGV
jgi:hypothetical protein